MDCISTLKSEHIYIKRMLDTLREMSKKLLEDDYFSYEDFSSIMDFITNYLGKYHNDKEAFILYEKVSKELKNSNQTLIHYGILFEHNYTNLYTLQLSQALEKLKEGNNDSKVDIIANSIGFANILDRHILKEDKIIFEYIKKHLTSKTLKQINEECAKYQENAIINNIEHKYVKMLVELENKYVKTAKKLSTDVVNC